MPRVVEYSQNIYIGKINKRFKTQYKEHILKIKFKQIFSQN